MKQKLISIKKIEWLKGSRQSIRSFPDDARNIAGNQLWLVQKGEEPDDWKPIKQVGPGAMEIRVHKPHEHRVIYVAKFPEAIYVLHAFEKKTAKLPREDMNIARSAYAEMEKIRRNQKLI